MQCQGLIARFNFAGHGKHVMAKFDSDNRKRGQIQFILTTKESENRQIKSAAQPLWCVCVQSVSDPLFIV